MNFFLNNKCHCKETKVSLDIQPSFKLVLKADQHQSSLFNPPYLIMLGTTNKYINVLQALQACNTKRILQYILLTI